VGELREGDVLRGEGQQLLLVEVVSLHALNLPAPGAPADQAGSGPETPSVAVLTVSMALTSERPLPDTPRTPTVTWPTVKGRT
jgi:hypothetical protein